MDWDFGDIRHFLAVARSGSTSAAAKNLKINQTTCARRIAGLEHALGLVLFDRAASGYRLTAAGASLLGHAEAIEKAATALDGAAQDQARVKRSSIRFSTSDVLADLVAGQAIASFGRVHPNVSVVFNADSRAVDLAQNEADVALRAAPIMDDPQLVVRKVMETPWAFYCAAAHTRTQGKPGSAAELAGYPLATLEGRPAALLAGALPGAEFRYVSNSMKALVEVLKVGECIGALPMLVGEQNPELERCFVLDIDAGGLWIVYHEKLRHAPHVRAFVDHLSAFLQQWRQRLTEQKVDVSDTLAKTAVPGIVHRQPVDEIQLIPTPGAQVRARGW